MTENKFPRYEQSGAATYYLIDTDAGYRIGEKAYGSVCEIPVTKSEAVLLLGVKKPAFVAEIQLHISRAKRVNSVHLKRF